LNGLTMHRLENSKPNFGIVLASDSIL